MALNYASGVSVNPAAETTVVSWTADGVKQVVGFDGESKIPAEFRLYSGATLYYQFRTTTNGLNAFIADKAFIPTAATVIALKAYHEGPAAYTFSGTILGG